MSALVTLKNLPVAIVAIAALVLTLVSGEVHPAAGAERSADIQRALKLMQDESDARAEIVKEASPAVVNITVVSHAQEDQSQEVPEIFNDPFFRQFFGNPQVQPQPQNRLVRGLGTGIILDSDGHILTNNHVIAGAESVTVKLLDGREFKGKVLGADPQADLAVVKIDAKGLPFLKLGNSDQLQVGQSVLAIGNPFGLDQTVTSGIVSAKGRTQVGIEDYENFIQTDAAINPGNSGGPLLNLQGEVVGINTAILSRSGGSVGIGFAIPINLARQIATELQEHGKVVRGYLGVGIQQLTPALAQALGIAADSGVLVAGVEKDSPAGRVNLKQGDVIVSFDGHPVTTPSALRFAVAGIAPGKTVTLEFLRDGKRQQVSITVAEQPSRMTAAAESDQNTPDDSEGPGKPAHILGMAVLTLTADLGNQAGYPGMHGVLIAQVDDSGAASDAGLERGMLIVSVNQHAVESIKALREQVSRAPAKKPLLLLVRAGDTDRYVALPKP
jgi:serine protease Do